MMTIDLGIPGIEGAEEIGRGGFAIVYRARQPAYRREVAVKVLSARVDETALARFEREIAAMGSLGEHPGIVALHSAGRTAQGQPYLVMPHMSGGSLQDLLDGGETMSPREASEVLTRLASALQAAHDEGVLHRDIKPANVLLGRFGDPMLADFGIARIAGGHETTAGVITASVVHAAPEILDGKAPSTASDIYSLASTIYALLSGAPAFASDTDQSIVPLISRTMTAPVPDIEGLPPAAMAVLAGAMAKNPDERPTTAVELASDFEDALAGRVPPRRPPASPGRSGGDQTAIVGGPAHPPATAASARSPQVADAAAVRASRPTALIVGGAIMLLLVVAVIGFGVIRSDDDAAVTDPAESTVEATEGAAVGADGGAFVDDDPDETGEDISDDPTDAGLGVVPVPAVALPPVDASSRPAENVDLTGALDLAVVDRALAAPEDGRLDDDGDAVTVTLQPGEMRHLGFPVPDGAVVRARTLGEEIDTGLVLRTADGLFLRADDDSGGGQTGANALLDFPVMRPGPHGIVVVNIDDSPGTTTLLLRIVVPQTLTAGQVLDGALSSADEPHAFRIVTGRPPAGLLSMTADAFDPSLRLVDPRGRQLAVAEGGTTVAIDLQALPDGAYIAIAGTDDDVASGPFRLAVE